MLDAYIIDAIRRQERSQEERSRTWLELPLDPQDIGRSGDNAAEKELERTVVIIPLNDGDDDQSEDDEHEREIEAA